MTVVNVAGTTISVETVPVRPSGYHCKFSTLPKLGANDVPQSAPLRPPSRRPEARARRTLTQLADSTQMMLIGGPDRQSAEDSYHLGATLMS